MGNEEYKEIMCELYKFLRDKISLSLGNYLNNEQKEKLFSFELDNIVIDNEFKKIVKYSFDDGKIHISDVFLTPEYIERVKSKNPEFDLENLKTKITNEDYKILLEELITFSSELKIQEKDIIKSLFIQEMLKMLIMNKEMDPKEEVIKSGAIELLAHILGNQNGFVVSTPKKLLGELEVAISLKNELEDKFEETILTRNVLEYLSSLENVGLINKIEELTNNRKIIESTQNLDNVINTIVQMKEPVMNNQVENKEPAEKIVNIDKTLKIESIDKDLEKTNTDLKVPNEAIKIELPNKKVKSKKMILSIIGVMLVVALGILVGWLLFKFK